MWTEMMNTLDLQALDEKTRATHEQVIQATKRKNMLPPTEIMITLLLNMKTHLTVEQLK
jgi:hypothetical protein